MPLVLILNENIINITKVKIKGFSKDGLKRKKYR